MTTVAIVYHSGNGHTLKQAKAVAEGVQGVDGARAQLISVEKVDDHWDDLEKAEAIIFGAPTYMGSASAEFKRFMDASSKIWYAQGWKDKIAAGFTNSSSQSGDKLNTLLQFVIFAGQHSMTWINPGMLPGNNNSKGSIEDLNRLGGFIGAMAQSNFDEPADVAPPATDLRTAAKFGARVAEATIRWTGGRKLLAQESAVRKLETSNA
ncbi:flavodoxin family protein [Bradyrhizobium genosp. A]|uniref:flavodoxin family protein n=1 Tax=Bradyrhizobium genosp. A TaxID=83626 RepID=UPI003CF6813E